MSGSGKGLKMGSQSGAKNDVKVNANNHIVSGFLRFFHHASLRIFFSLRISRCTNVAF